MVFVRCINFSELQISNFKLYRWLAYAEAADAVAETLLVHGRSRKHAISGEFTPDFTKPAGSSIIDMLRSARTWRFASNPGERGGHHTRSNLKGWTRKIWGTYAET